jgi:hypothetical protein
MPNRISVCIALAALAAAPAVHAATATVEYVNPEKFTDAGNTQIQGEREGNLGQLKAHLIERAGKLLPADQKLAVTVTNVDLAGSYDPRQRASSEVRTQRDAFPPRMDLSFRLEGADGTVLKEGSRKLSDPNFLQSGLRYKGEKLGYEKELIDDWLRREFPRPKR